MQKQSSQSPQDLPLSQNNHRSGESGQKLDMELLHLQKIFDAAQVGLLLVTGHGTVGRVNDVISRLVGKNARDMLGKRPGKALHCIETAILGNTCGEGESCDSCPFRNTFREVLETGKALEGVEAEKEFYLNNRKTTRCFSLNARKLEMEGNTQVLMTLYDVTERKISERKLREEKERFEQIASLAGEMVWEVDTEGQYTYVSQASKKILGYAPHELIGKMYFYDLHPKENREAFKKAVAEFFENRETIRNYENSALTAQGREITLLTNGLPLFDHTGQWRGYRGVDQEITEQKKAEKLVREQETLLKTILNAINAPVFYKDEKGIYLGCNDAFENFLGRRREEIIGHTAFDIAPKYLAEQYHQADQALIENGQCRIYECQVVNSKGERKDVMFHKAPFYNARGEVKGLVGAMLDITDIKKTQKELRESEERHRVLFESSKDALFILSPPHWTFVDANPSAISLFKVDNAQQLIGRTPLDISPEYQADGRYSAVVSMEMVNKAMRKGSHMFEWTHLDFQGKELSTEVILTSMTFGGQHYLLASVRDITMRKRAQEAVAEAKGEAEREAAKLSAMIAAMEEGVLFADRDNRVIEVNDALCGLLNRHRDEILAHSLEDLKLEKHIQNLPSYMAAFRELSSTEPCTCQTRLPKADVIFRVLPIIRNRTFDGILISCVDITELANAKKQLEVSNRELEKSIERSELLAEKSEMASRAKSEFLANMSHEIRTPMTAILGYTDIILEANNDPETRNAASTIKRNGRHLLEIINDVLDLAKVESGKQSVDCRLCSPHQVVADVVSLLRVQTEGKGLSLDVEYQTPIPEKIRTDPARMRQILLNLVGNAIKFTELGGIEVRVSLLRPPSGSPRMCFDVIDSGIGMDHRQLAQLFQPFFQLDCSPTRRFGGTGLGLTISKHFAQMLGGDLSVRSRPGEGSTFTLTIETGSLDGIAMVENASEIEIPPQGEETEIPLKPNMLSGRILLAEDGPDNQRLISLLLKKAGAEVELVENGQEAVERIQAMAQKGTATLPHIDLVLMDIQMPVLDGLDATHILRKGGYTGPIIALTAHAMEQDVRNCLKAGCDTHLTKPIQRNTFFRTLQYYLYQSRAEKEQRRETRPRSE